MNITKHILVAMMLSQGLLACGNRNPKVTPEPNPSASTTPVQSQVSASINPSLETNDAVIEEVNKLQDEGVLSDVMIMESYPVQISAKGPADVIKRLQAMAAGQSSQEQKVSFVTLSKRTSRIKDAGTKVVFDAASFDTLWLQHNGSTQQKPEVNFDSETVIAVFSGQKNTGGYLIEITRILQTGSQLNVYYKETSPGSEDLTSQVITSPAHLVKIPLSKSQKDFENVTFTAE